MMDEAPAGVKRKASEDITEAQTAKKLKIDNEEDDDIIVL